MNAVSQYQGSTFNVWNYGAAVRNNMYGLTRVDNFNNNNAGIYNISLTTNSRVYNNATLQFSGVIFKGST
jgi:hypothetical protein